VSPLELLGAAAILGGLGTAFGILIAYANRRFEVWEDPRITAVEELLPATNCGACGTPGCRAFAIALIDGDKVPTACTVMGHEEVDDVASYLGVAAGDTAKVVARLLCAGGIDVAPYKADYQGMQSCAAAVAVTGGGKGCPWGCVGYADCAVSCDFDAITMSETMLPVVDLELCTACNDCVEACPLDLFVLMPADHHLVVQCKNLLNGEAATDVCTVACNACARCVQDAEPGLIEMIDGLAIIDYRKIQLENVEAIERCPTGAIVWMEGQQFPTLFETAGSDLA
jgi:electron transport complex protein RnfB